MFLLRCKMCFSIFIMHVVIASLNTIAMLLGVTSVTSVVLSSNIYIITSVVSSFFGGGGGRCWLLCFVVLLWLLFWGGS